MQPLPRAGGTHLPSPLNRLPQHQLWRGYRQTGPTWPQELGTQVALPIPWPTACLCLLAAVQIHILKADKAGGLVEVHGEHHLGVQAGHESHSAR